MNQKVAGSIYTKSKKTIGQLYQPSASRQARSNSNVPKGLVNSRQVNVGDRLQKRTGSVGKIINVREREGSSGKKEDAVRDLKKIIQY